MKSKKGFIPSLPQPLFRSTAIQFALAVLLLIVGIVATLYFDDRTYLIILLISVYLAVSGVLTVHKWHIGQILEVPVACIGVSEDRMFRNMVNVYFTTDAQFDVELPGNYKMQKKGCPYVDGMPYLLYIDKSNLSHIIAYTDVGM